MPTTGAQGRVAGGHPALRSVLDDGLGGREFTQIPEPLHRGVDLGVSPHNLEKGGQLPNTA